MGRLVIALALVTTLVIGGCGKSEKVPPLVEVSGTVLDSNGNPLDEVRVTFLPDPEKDGWGQPASGMTDSSGKFVLHYDSNEELPGTAVGINRVILSDVKAKNTSRDENPMMQRFHQKYLRSQTTDLWFDVKEGESQQFEIKVESN